MDGNCVGARGYRAGNRRSVELGANPIADALRAQFAGIIAVQQPNAVTGGIGDERDDRTTRLQSQRHADAADAPRRLAVNEQRGRAEQPRFARRLGLPEA